MSSEAGEQVIRTLGRRVREAVEEYGTLAVVNALEGALDDLDQVEERVANEVERARPRSSGYDTLDEYRTAVRQWRAWRAERSGPATRRGRVPPVLTRSLEHD